MTTQTQNNPSLGGLLQDLRDETTTLLRQEVALAKAEMTEKASKMGARAAQLAIGGFVAYAGLIVLLFGLADLIASLFMNAGMDSALAVWLSRAIVGIVIALVGYFMLARAKKAMAEDNLVPEQTLQSLRQNKAWAQTKLRHTHEQQPAV